MQSWQNDHVLPNMEHRTPTADGWLFGTNGPARFAATLDSDTPDDTIPASICVTCTTAEPTMAAASERHLRFAIYGKKLFPFKGQDIKVRALVKRSRAGAQSVACVNEPRNRAFISDAGVDTAHQWQQLEFSFPVSAIDGFVNYGDGYGLGFRVSVGSGSVYQASTGVWHPGNYASSPNQVNMAQTVGDYLKITKVQIWAGPDEGFVLPDATFVSLEASNEIRVIRQQAGGVNIIGHGANAGGVGDPGTVNFDLLLASPMYTSPKVSFLGAYGTDYEIQNIADATAVAGISHIECFPRSRDVAKYTAYKTDGGVVPGLAYSFRLKTPSAGILISGHHA